MQEVKQTFQKQALLQFILFLFVNALFIIKYVLRTPFNPIIALGVYVISVSSVFFLLRRRLFVLSERTGKYLCFCLLACFSVVIVFILLKVDPYSVRVDRWSAVTFFLDYLFQGQYPYGASTHVSATNYPSPFPVWYVVNLPFYCMGDVGYNLIFFLFFITFVLRYFFDSYKQPLFFLLMLLLSPAYWWEVIVRSDSLSNGFLVLGFILWYAKKGYSLSGNFWLTVLCCGLLSSSRLSALLPVALFFFKPYTKLSLKQMILFPFSVLLILFITFSPFVFWDTQDWVFFSRNPFMSQGGAGNIYVLLLLMALGVLFSFLWKNMSQFFGTTAVYMLVFFAVSQVVMVSMVENKETAFGWELYDISYFTLLLPYCFCFLVNLKNDIFSYAEVFNNNKKIFFKK